MSERLDLELLADLAEPQNLCISPDGKRVVYQARPKLVRKSEYTQAVLWIAELGKENSARQLTHNEYDNYLPKFSPDGKYISFLSDRSKPGKSAVLYLLPLDGGEAFPLTSEDNEMGVGGYHWSPSGKSIAFLSADEKTEERKQKEKDKDDQKVYGENVDYARLRIVDTETKEVRSFGCVQENASQFAWKEDGSKIALATSKTTEIDEMMSHFRLYIVDIEKDSSEEVLSLPSMIGDICWYQDRLLWNGEFQHGYTTSSRAVCALSLQHVSKGHEVIAHGEVDCIDSIKICNNEILVYVTQGLTDIIETLEGKELYSAKRQICGWDAYIEASQTSIVLADGVIGSPTEVFSIVNGERTQLSRHGKQIADQKIGRAHLFEYTHEDGTPIDGFYAIPAALESAFVEKKPQKTVVIIHGGPYARVTDTFDMFWSWPAYFMSLGYLVLCPNYRGGSSHGNEYAMSVWRDASQSYQDIIWIIKKGIAEGYIDPEYVATTGWSQGGYLSYLAVTRDDTFHFRAAVPGAGVTHWSTMALTSDLPTFEMDISGPAPWVADINDLNARKCSPMYHMQNVTTPVLIVHGEADQRTPLEQAVGFYRALKSKGKDVTLVTYPREGHCYPVPWEKKHYIDMMDRVGNFLKKHME